MLNDQIDWPELLKKIQLNVQTFYKLLFSPIFMVSYNFIVLNIIEVFNLSRYHYAGPKLITFSNS